MCGIGGKVAFDSHPGAALGERMADCMTQRGPDDDGVYASGPTALAFRRLAILDTSDAGAQPMANEDGTAHVVFNGEIYNYRELRDRLTGYTFDSGSDTEVLLAAYEEYGVDCLRHFRGMFAFAIWDEREERLFLARDRLGQKPLFLHECDDGVVFSSTVKALLADDEIAATPDLAAIREYLTYGYVPGPATGFDGISQLPPGEYALVDEDGISRERYWRPSFASKRNGSPARFAHDLRTHLRDAVRLRMRSDVPVGLFLSGGVDSTVVAALMDEVSDRPIETYSIGFDVDDYDELEHANLVADAYGTNHHEYVVTPDSVRDLTDLVGEFELPFGDPSALPTHHVADVASADITVALNGDGGDENFAGYDRYRYDRLAGYANRLPRDLREYGERALDAIPASVAGKQPVRYAKRFLRGANGDPVERYAEFVCHALPGDLCGAWTGPGESDRLAAFRAAFARADGPTRLDRLQQVDLETYLPDDLLVKADRATMMHSVEGRSPFLDHELVEFAASVPAAYKYRRGEGKWLLKRAFEAEIPDPILDRPKQGFGVPVDEWFRGDLYDFARERLRRLGERDPFSRANCASLLEEHASGRAEHGFRLWDLVWLESWYEQFIDDA